MKINKAVIYYYELCGISQYKLATVSGIDRGALHRMLKNDEWEPNTYTLSRLAKAVSVKVSDIILKAEELENE
jgi:DNA-binding XRE family transcriptional regulator